jgi:broad specificity phosphatase PhoE
VATTLLLARHGESDWNRERRWQGHADRPLTDRGREQAAALAARLADLPLDAVYSSDLRRARETAAAVAGPRGLEVRQRPALREVDVGGWSGLTREEVAERYPDAFREWEHGFAGWDDGETYRAMCERVVGEVLRIAANHDGRCVLVVAHGGPIRAIHAAALGLDVHAYRRLRPAEPNARLSAVCAEDARLTAVRPAGRIGELLAGEGPRPLEPERPPTPAG